MNVYDVLKMAESVLQTVEANNIHVGDVKRLQMYEDYRRLKRERLKKTYIVNYLVDQYGVPEPTVYRLIKRMERTVKL